jgi:hypothetical protein
VKRNVLPGSVVFADEARHWDVLARAFVTKRIDHSEAYSLDGSHTNNAEKRWCQSLIPAENNS